MKGDAQAIAHLQAQLKNELTAINQYYVHYRMLKHWGFDRLAKKEYEESIGEMKHADKLMERIFMLDGLPNLQDLAKLQIGEDVPEILECDLRAERGAQTTITEGIAYCESVRDYVSRDLLQDILEDTEEHIDFLETQIELVDKVGLHHYLQSQMGEADGHRTCLTTHRAAARFFTPACRQRCKANSYKGRQTSGRHAAPNPDFIFFWPGFTIHFNGSRNTCN